MAKRAAKKPVEQVDTSWLEEEPQDDGVTWFIVGALLIAAGVLAYLYFGG